MLLLLAAAVVGASPASAGPKLGAKVPKDAGAVEPGVTPTTPPPAPGSKGPRPGVKAPKDAGASNPGATPTSPGPAGQGVKPGADIPKDGGMLEHLVTPITPPAASAGPGIKPGVNIPKDGGVMHPGVRPTTPSPTPEVKGWPHSILSGSSTNCARNPLPHEVLVYRDKNFAGSCAVLVPGFYPYAGNFLVGNDAISSVKVGSEVRARVFKDPVFAGDWNAYAPGTAAAELGGFNDRISSIRVEPAKRSQLCDDLREGEIALFENPRGQGDCVVLPSDESYANAESMGIENDSISSMRNNSARRLTAYWHPSFSQGGIELPPHTLVDSLPGDGFLTEGLNDNISSIKMAN
ncbi:hypothetical protein [Nannocystis pusilla]|uniref:Beta/gamma crystallin 'Greek key' domain-containing protein n=1 Tax=Nannocystis pusilla TaxID=889268 RepID=A0ABS7TQY8_9BACT|nr:hypothetical protein [Nannocystis pusilla]MBZ5710652.1 hypothetical protein [Nannocystis pusilla]